MKKLIFVGLIFLVIFSCGFRLPKGYCEDQGDITGLIENLEIGEPVYYEALTIMPIYSLEVKGKSISFITLDEATRSGYLKVSEFEGGRVPQVKVSNTSGRYIYLMGGEILSGCKQDRLVARDVLIGPRSQDVLVTVYCVEQGRWTEQSGNFYSKENLAVNDFRSSAQISPSYSSERQSQIWTGITQLQRKHNVSSRTEQYQAVYEDRDVKSRVSSYENRMRDIPDLHSDTIGVVVGIGGRIVSADIFANARTFRKLWPKLLKSLALEAINSYGNGHLDQEDAVRFLRMLHDKDYASKSGIDEGREFSVVDGEVNANALLFDDTVIHIAAFPLLERSYTHYRQGSRVRVINNYD